MKSTNRETQHHPVTPNAKLIAKSTATELNHECVNRLLVHTENGICLDPHGTCVTMHCPPADCWFTRRVESVLTLTVPVSQCMRTKRLLVHTETRICLDPHSICVTMHCPPADCWFTRRVESVLTLTVSVSQCTAHQPIVGSYGEWNLS